MTLHDNYESLILLLHKKSLPRPCAVACLHLTEPGSAPSMREHAQGSQKIYRVTLLLIFLLISAFGPFAQSNCGKGRACEYRVQGVMRARISIRNRLVRHSPQGALDEQAGLRLVPDDPAVWEPCHLQTPISITERLPLRSISGYAPVWSHSNRQ